jgi:hypothetical protein
MKQLVQNQMSKELNSLKNFIQEQTELYKSGAIDDKTFKSKINYQGQQLLDKLVKVSLKKAKWEKKFPFLFKKQ